MRNFRISAWVAVAVVAPSADASTCSKLGPTFCTMCEAYDASFCGLDTTLTPAPSYYAGYYKTTRPESDQPVVVVAPTNTLGAQTSPRLLIFLHGTGGSPNGYNDLANRAAAWGYHVIVPDYPDGDLSPQSVCGCHTGTDTGGDNCYGWWFQIRWYGGSHAGLREITYANSIQGRVEHILTALGGSWASNFLDASHHLIWSKVAMGGHSQGTGLATWIAKHHAVARLITFSGDHNSGDWDYGANPNVSAHPNLQYHWGSETGAGYCTQDIVLIAPINRQCLSMATTDAHSPYHIRDNNFGSNTGTVWATSNADMYEYDDAAESHDMYDTAYNNMCTLNIDSRHAASCPVDGFLDVTTQLPNLTTCQNHGLLGDNTCGATMDIASRSHSATAADVSWCTISGRATRNAVWDFMLTN